MSAAAAGLARGAREFGRTSYAFMWISAMQTFAYPLSFVMQQLTSTVPAIMYVFVDRLVPDLPGVGNDYYTFAMIGLFAVRILSSALDAVGDVIDGAIDEGRMEMLLAQPVDWRMLPVGLAQWPILWRLVNLVVFTAVTIALGAHYDVPGVPAALLVVLLGLGATLSVGIIAAAAQLVFRRTSPVLFLYVTAVSIFSGVFYPVSELPGWMQVVSRLLPDTYVIDAMRSLLMPDYVGLGIPTGAVVAGIALFDVVMLPLSIAVFGRALDFGRRLGMLGGY